MDNTFQNQVALITGAGAGKKLKNKLFVTSKRETSNSPIHEFRVLHRDQSLLKPLFNGLLFLVLYLKKHFKPCFFI